MQHYFIDKTHNPEDYFEFNDSVLGFDLCFRSCDSIFSKNKIDDGTRALLQAIEKNENLTGTGLEVGCGLGCLSIPLIKKFNVKIDMFDVNNTAVKLCKENLIKNNVKSGNAFLSNGFENVSGNYNFIVSNPPIKTGKKLLFELMNGCLNHLTNNGSLMLVIRKDLGMESLKKYLTNLFGNCEILDRNKGYYILKSVKG